MRTRRRNRAGNRGLSTIASVIDRNGTLENTVVERGRSFRLGDVVAPRQTAAMEYSALESSILDAFESAGVIERVGGDVWVRPLEGYLDDTSPIGIEVLEIHSDPGAAYRGSAYVLRATIPEGIELA